MVYHARAVSTNGSEREFAGESTLHSTITEGAAKDLGRTLRFIRQAKQLTLRDVAIASGLSMQYIGQIETAQRVGVSEEAIRRLAGPLGLGDGIAEDLMLRARVQSALEARGLSTSDVDFVWRGVEQRMKERGHELRTDVASLVSELLAAR